MIGKVLACRLGSGDDILHGLIVLSYLHVTHSAGMLCMLLSNKLNSK